MLCCAKEVQPNFESKNMFEILTEDDDDEITDTDMQELHIAEDTLNEVNKEEFPMLDKAKLSRAKKKE